jgi:hypothetical protein
LWMVIDTRFFTSQSKRGRRRRRSNITKSQPCTCAICNHDHEEMCFQNRCACCLISKNDEVIGHSNNALQ